MENNRYHKAIRIMTEIIRAEDCVIALEKEIESNLAKLYEQITVADSYRRIDQRLLDACFDDRLQLKGAPGIIDAKDNEVMFLTSEIRVCVNPELCYDADNSELHFEAFIGLLQKCFEISKKKWRDKRIDVPF